MEKCMDICPLDSRYSDIKDLLSPIFSEYAYIKYRLFVEISWLNYLIDNKFVVGDKKKVEKIINEFSISSFNKIKEIENETKHDVKAIEYFIDLKLKEFGLNNLISFVHIGLTSEDVNNTAYALMIKDFLSNIYYPKINEFLNYLKKLSRMYKKVVILSHTHGQAASPTTIGKELKVYIYRIETEIKRLKNIKIKAKFNGATGNYSALHVVYPQLMVDKFSKSFIESLNLYFNPFTTQIENHDYIVSIVDQVRHINNIILDLDLDMWLYISYGYFKLKVINKEVGSSTMPHKVNPINFENSESNMETSNSLLMMLSNKLPRSRMQRDLSDSSTLRNLGMSFGYSLQGIKETLKGLNRISVNKKIIEEELNNNYEVLAEAIQTMLRKYGIEDAYQRLKELTRGKNITKEIIEKFIETLEISEEDKRILLSLEPKKYIGLADKM